jgi:hypothetical protein
VDDMNIDKLFEDLNKVIDDYKKQSLKDDKRFEVRFWSVKRPDEYSYSYSKYRDSIDLFYNSIESWRYIEIFDRLEDKVLVTYFNEINCRYRV